MLEVDAWTGFTAPDDRHCYRRRHSGRVGLRRPGGASRQRSLRRRGPPDVPARSTAKKIMTDPPDGAEVAGRPGIWGWWHHRGQRPPGRVVDHVVEQGDGHDEAHPDRLRAVPAPRVPLLAPPADLPSWRLFRLSASADYDALGPLSRRIDTALIRDTGTTCAGGRDPAHQGRRRLRGHSGPPARRSPDHAGPSVG